MSFLVIQLPFGARAGIEKALQIGISCAHSHHGPCQQKKHSRVTGKLQDKIWQVEVHQLPYICA